jgi:hypothetical protein
VRATLGHAQWAMYNMCRGHPMREGGEVKRVLFNSPVSPYECTSIILPVVSAGSELSGLLPQELVVKIGTLTPSLRNCSIIIKTVIKVVQEKLRRPVFPRAPDLILR